ncbi:hypothetical protein ADK41_09955 [Streptomyces caelestis]|uniref:Uncharacterized protein n=2 Tax=Streptomyces TaxID=1883 RepID=A0A0M8QKK0_9ACTN|nr:MULTISPECIES: hypothetical protein [Streptomyces]KOT41658.1 hypothetical protein ADK41_09955 [Streptomyces caelestis]
MLKHIEAMGARMVALVAPSLTAEAAAAEVCYDEYSHCARGCNWGRNRLAYDRICNGQYRYTWYADCGTCAD